MRYIFLTSELCALPTPDSCTVYITYVTHYWPLRSMHYMLLSPALCTLYDLDPCTLLFTHSWLLNYVLYTPDPWTMYSKLCWNLHSVHYPLISLAHCMVHSSGTYTVYITSFSHLYVPGTCILDVIYTWHLHPVCFTYMTPVLCANIKLLPRLAQCCHT